MRMILFSCVALLGLASLVQATDPSAAKLAALIDNHLSTVWKKNGAQPAPVVDDATFLRRVSLDLIGRIPTVAEVRDFLADKSSDKRARLIDRLIDSGEHARHLATFWRRTWIPQADTPQFLNLAEDFETWIAVRLQKNRPYDQIVRELLTIPVSSGIPTISSRDHVTPAAFFTANENKPESLAASASRAFLGVNLDCAQCHNHPFARWTRDQFWQTAAFFAPPRTDKQGKMIPAALTIPNTSRSMSPRYVDGKEVKWPRTLTSRTGREVLARWVTHKENPYFARNAVNRLWARIYGTGLVEPLDDLSNDAVEESPHTKLLDQLADELVKNGYDLKSLTRGLVLAKAYQLSTRAPKAASTEIPLFTHAPVRALTGEQLYDSLRTAAGLPPERNDTQQGQGLLARQRFAVQFHVERPVSAERSIIQALALMNGEQITELTDATNNKALAAVASAPFLSTRDKVEALFLAVLGHPPTKQQLAILSKHVEKKSTKEGSRRALGDIFWALVNSTEFNTNH